MISCDSEIKGLDSLLLKIELFDKKAPSEIAKIKNEVAEVVFSDVVKNTPIDTGTLVSSWNLKGINQYETKIYNNAVNKGEYYAWDVEYGHRVKSKNGWVSGTGGGIKYVKGVFMLRDAFERGSKMLENKANITLEQLMRG